MMYTRYGSELHTFQNDGVWYGNLIVYIRLKLVQRQSRLWCRALSIRHESGYVHVCMSSISVTFSHADLPWQRLFQYRSDVQYWKDCTQMDWAWGEKNTSYYQRVSTGIVLSVSYIHCTSCTIYALTFLCLGWTCWGQRFLDPPSCQDCDGWHRNSPWRGFLWEFHNQRAWSCPLDFLFLYQFLVGRDVRSPETPTHEKHKQRLSLHNTSHDYHPNTLYYSQNAYSINPFFFVYWAEEDTLWNFLHSWYQELGLWATHPKLQVAHMLLLIHVPVPCTVVAQRLQQ